MLAIVMVVKSETSSASLSENEALPFKIGDFIEINTEISPKPGPPRNITSFIVLGVEKSEDPYFQREYSLTTKDYENHSSFANAPCHVYHIKILTDSGKKIILGHVSVPLMNKCIKKGYWIIHEWQN